MTAIAMTRYYMVLKPTVYPRYFTDKKISIIMILIWIFSYLERVPPTFDLWGTVDVYPKTLLCSSYNYQNTYIDPSLMLSNIAFIPPCLVMSFSYVFLICFLPMVLIDSIDDEKYYPELHVLHTVLSCAIVFINPIIYACSNKRYRNAYKAIFKSSGNGSSNQPDISCQTPRCLSTK
ncbi:rhodopsin, GQ-coupled-like [Aphidius gifuensis]|uniref:rhodopsin, GQ-coupled-like n=1 Tax=Aphidius gifuensis TaxID=684658 RepID=UPI001CDBD16D|nr:rhodopsin, GQ-coupled-like [Aphidius gifuensis]